MTFVLVDTDNYGGDYPDEKFVVADSILQTGFFATTTDVSLAHKWGDREAAQSVAKQINDHWGDTSPRYLKVEEETYQLQPGFEP